MTRTPNLFLVGAPKAGTSAFYAALAQHPDVFMSRKEPHFFGADIERLHHKPLTHEQYLALFAPARDEIRVGEGSTSYLHSATAARELHAFAPDAKILVMLRNPVDAMYAYHATHVKAGFEQIHDFERALAMEGERRAGRMLPRSHAGLRETLYYREVATYSPQVRRYLDVFGSESVKVILFDDWVSEPASIYRETADFLGIDPNYRPAIEVVNPNRRIRSPAAHRFINEPPVRLRQVAGLLVPRARRARIVYALSRSNTRIGARPPMRPELRRALLEEFSPEIERLGALISRDLSHWAQGRRLVEAGTSA